MSFELPLLSLLRFSSLGLQKSYRHFSSSSSSTLNRIISNLMGLYLRIRISILVLHGPQGFGSCIHILATGIDFFGARTRRDRSE